MGLDKFRHKFRTEIFDAKASNKAHVWVNGVGRAYWMAKIIILIKVTHSSEVSLIGCIESL